MREEFFDVRRVTPRPGGAGDIHVGHQRRERRIAVAGRHRRAYREPHREAAAESTPAGEYLQQNVAGTRNLLEALSSEPDYVAVRERRRGVRPGTGALPSEPTAPHPNGAYAASKLEAEQTAMA